MLHYETLLLTRIEITEDDASMLERTFDKIISDIGGKLITFDRWGKYRLAYPIKKNTHGVYILTRYQLPSNKAQETHQELDSFLKIKCNDLVIRHLNIKLDPNEPISYQKPEPVDASSRSSLDKFFKENKVEKLLSSVEAVKIDTEKQKSTETGSSTSKDKNNDTGPEKEQGI